MLVPQVAASSQVSDTVQRTIGYLPYAYFGSDVGAALDAAKTAQPGAHQAIICDASSVDDATQALNSGVSIAVLSAELAQTAAGIDRARIGIRLAQGSPLEPAAAAGTVVVSFTAAEVLAGAVARLEGVRVLVELAAPGTWTLEMLSAVADAGAHPVVPAAQLAALPLAQAVVAGCGLHTDRPDGLFTTAVVDERGVCLGIAYSNTESLARALEVGQGVYWSRKRGLWHKGLTSGATQELRAIAVDCDGDTLCFRVAQGGGGFCHLGTRTCFGADGGLAALARTIEQRKVAAPQGSYTQRLFGDAALLRAKIMEEADELCRAQTKDEVAFEAADLVYFAMVRCAAAGVSLADVERSLDAKHAKVVRRPGNAKPQWAAAPVRTSLQCSGIRPAAPGEPIRMRSYDAQDLSDAEYAALLQRPTIDSGELMGRVRPIVDAVRARGDAAVRELTRKFDRVELDGVVMAAPFDVPALPERVRAAIDQAYANVTRFHAAQATQPLTVETMPGVKCSRFSRAIERVGLYVPGGSAVLPSSALMLGAPAQVAGCKQIVIATPPRADGSVVPEVLYVAHKVGASHIVRAGGAQAIAAMAYGTESVPKVDKICGPGNQYVTAAKMLVQNDTHAMVSIDMPAGPSEVLVVADASANPAYVASDLLSQAEHGPDSQVVLLAVSLPDALLDAIAHEVHTQAERLPRVAVVRESIPKSFALRVGSLDSALDFSNAYAPEHLILHIDNAARALDRVTNAGSVFVGQYSPESCGDYASGTNHTLPTYGFSRMYSGVSTATFVKHITAQELSPAGLSNIAETVMALAETEELEAHRNAVAIRMRDLERR